MLTRRNQIFRCVAKLLLCTMLIALPLLLVGCSGEQLGPALTYNMQPEHNEVVSTLETIFSFVKTDLLASFESVDQHETQEQTPYAVYKGQHGGPVLTHYMFSEHKEVTSALETISSFVEIDLTQSWERLDWEALRPLVRMPFYVLHEGPHTDIARWRQTLANGYRINKLQTKVENVEISHIAYIAEAIVPGHPITFATALGKVTIRYLRADPSWLEQQGVILETDYTFNFEVSIHKMSAGPRDQSLGDIISEVWKVGGLRYEVTPSERLPIGNR